VYVHLDERAGSNLLLAIGYHPRYRVAALLAGNERAGNYLQPAVDQTKVVQASLKTKFISGWAHLDSTTDRESLTRRSPHPSLLSRGEGEPSAAHPKTERFRP